MAINYPQWQRELLNYKGIKSLFVLEKNTNDLYPTIDSMFDGDSYVFLPMVELLTSLFQDNPESSSYKMVFYDPISHFTNPMNDADVGDLIKTADREAQALAAEEARLNSFAPQGGQEQRLVRDARVIRALLTRNTAQQGEVPQPVCVVVSMASRLAVSAQNLMPDDLTLFSHLLLAADGALSPDAKSKNTLVLVADNLRDLPEWLISSNPNMRSIVVPKPDRDARAAYIDSYFGLSEESPRPGEKTEREKFIDKTEGMTLRELDELRRMHERSGEGLEGLPSLVDVYKYGLRENKWAEIADKLDRDPGAAIRRRVKGQDQAVEAAVSVLKRSALGLSGSTHSGSGKPKGILFLAGPTGTGKTELVKAVTELLFGDERSMLRFDMSEYRGDNSDQRLFGAPPGYVGYSQGGQLTNAVKANPFSVLLFDEVEKANASVMDKFLQILEDGRMTDGQGNTVYFSETIIFFTSNVGFSEEILDPTGHRVVERITLIEPGEPYEVICEKVHEAMNKCFKPEFLGRIGNNIVVFNFIDDVSARAILKSKIDQINRGVETGQGVLVTVDQSCIDMLAKEAVSDEVREKGGRGIGNLIETAYLNPLSDFLFDEKIGKGERVSARSDGNRVVFGRGGAAS